MADLVDHMGLSLDTVLKWLPSRASEFPTPPAIRNTKAVQEWRKQWAYTPCWYCGRATGRNGVRGEAHHIVRHDAPWALFWCCDTCHRLVGDVAMKKNLHRVLAIKHERDDPKNTMWLPLALGRGSFLPEE